MKNLKITLFLFSLFAIPYMAHALDIVVVNNLSRDIRLKIESDKDLGEINTTPYITPIKVTENEFKIDLASGDTVIIQNFKKDKWKLYYSQIYVGNLQQYARGWQYSTIITPEKFEFPKFTQVIAANISPGYLGRSYLKTTSRGIWSNGGDPKDLTFIKTTIDINKSFIEMEKKYENEKPDLQNLLKDFAIISRWIKTIKESSPEYYISSGEPQFFAVLLKKLENLRIGKIIPQLPKNYQVGFLKKYQKWKQK